RVRVTSALDVVSPGNWFGVGPAPFRRVTAPSHRLFNDVRQTRGQGVVARRKTIDAGPGIPLPAVTRASPCPRMVGAPNLLFGVKQKNLFSQTGGAPLACITCAAGALFAIDGLDDRRQERDLCAFERTLRAWIY